LKILIAYDSVSPEKNTEKVAEAMRDALMQKGTDAKSSHVKDVDVASVGGYDCLIVGSPTHAWRPTEPVRVFLDKLTPQVAYDKSAAAFDTRIKSFFAGGAAGGIEGKLKKLGFKIAAPPLALYVKGEAAKEQKRGVVKLIDGELDKARRFAEQVANSLQ